MINDKIHLSEFHSGDDMAAFASAMEYLRAHPGTALVIEPGTYTLTGELAKSAMASVMNGDWGANPQRIMFHPKYEYDRGISFDGVKNCRVEGYGATLMVDGFMEPISLVNCENIELCGVTIDHIRKPYTRGVIASESERDTDGSRTCEITLDQPVTEKSPFTLRYIFYDMHSGQNIPCGIKSYKITDPTHVRAVLSSPAEKLTGLEFYTVHTYHSRPAILIENAKNITLTDVTIHSQPGMGVVGNRCEDVTMRRLNVVPSVGHHYSTNTDATHFTSMKGTLRYENCVFDGQGDDFTNVHTYYQAVIGHENGNTYLIQEKTPDGTHAQTLDFPDIGDTMELVCHDTLQVIGHYTVTGCEPMPEKWMCRVTLDQPLPENTDGLMLSDITRTPFVEIIGCTASRHFARSILLKTRRGALVEGNHFRDVQGPAIVAAAESWWYEGVCPANITIRRNRIVNCARNWGEAAGIVVKADSDHPKGRTITNITIEDNIIDCPNHPHGIFLRNIDTITLVRNRINTKDTPIIIEDCTNITRKS